MNEQIKERWLEALRHPFYKKGRQYLHRRTNQFCAIGVLCNLHSQATGHGWEMVPKEPCLLYYGRSGQAPVQVLVWAGLDHYTAGVITQLNDRTGGFATVIRHIEATL